MLTLSEMIQHLDEVVGCHFGEHASQNAYGALGFLAPQPQHVDSWDVAEGRQRV